MKRSNIEVGQVYSNGKSHFRLVTNVGPQFKLYPGQEDHDCVQYIAVSVRKKGLTVVSGSYDESGKHSFDSLYHNTTRTSFAAWAKLKADAFQAHEIKSVIDKARKE